MDFIASELAGIRLATEDVRPVTNDRDGVVRSDQRVAKETKISGPICRSILLRVNSPGTIFCCRRKLSKGCFESIRRLPNSVTGCSSLDCGRDDLFGRYNTYCDFGHSQAVIRGL